MALQGNIDSFSVIDVLRLLAASSKTGRLAVDGDRGTVGIWLDDGAVVAAESTRRGGRPVASAVGDVIFDVLRFREGAFVFDADVRHEAPSLPVAIDPAIDEAQSALGEWEAIAAIVPSARSALSVALELPVPTVELDQRRWSGVCAVAAGGTGRRGAVTVEMLAERLGLGELAAMRLAHDLATLGLIEVGEEQPVDTAPEQPSAPAEPGVFHSAGFEPAPGEHTPTGHTSAERAPAEPPAFGSAPLESTAFDAPAFETGPPTPTAAATFVDLPPLDDAFAAPAAPDAFAAGPAPFAPEAGAEVFGGEAFGGDVFGGEVFADGAFAEEPFAPVGDSWAPAAADLDPGIDRGIDRDAASDSDRDAGLRAIFGSVDPFATDPVAPSAEPAGGPEAADQAAQDAEFARQLAMLSPRAAEAVAGAEAGVSAEADERARVARFLGSV